MTMLDAPGRRVLDRKERLSPFRVASAFAGAVLGAVVTLAVGAGVLVAQQTHSVPASHSGRATITKAPIDHNGMVCLDPAKDSEFPPGPPCVDAAYTGVLGPDLATLQVGDKVRYTTFETDGDAFGTIRGVILYRPTDPEWEAYPPSRHS